ncbi:MAG: Rieske 2Fe-2S domain-containing protein [candidate division NC10 bacterium]|nr:Rieske 2Fe-2S domain-containing protein [candidate division NC10 bacterium]
MKLLDSYISRRLFLCRLFGGWLGGLVAVLGYPTTRFLAPAEAPEPPFVLLSARDFLSIPPNSTKTFAWGHKMGIFMKASDQSLRAFKGVCTHMDCNVTYKPEEHRFFCPCHNGWYDEAGVNIAGPPPRPLERLEVRLKKQKLIVHQPGIVLPPEVLG